MVGRTTHVARKYHHTAADHYKPQFPPHETNPVDNNNNLQPNNNSTANGTLSHRRQRSSRAAPQTTSDASDHSMPWWHGLVEESTTTPTSMNVVVNRDSLRPQTSVYDRPWDEDTPGSRLYPPRQTMMVPIMEELLDHLAFDPTPWWFRDVPETAAAAANSLDDSSGMAENGLFCLGTTTGYTTLTPPEQNNSQSGAATAGRSMELQQREMRRREWIAQYIDTENANVTTTATARTTTENQQHPTTTTTRTTVPPLLPVGENDGYSRNQKSSRRRRLSSSFLARPETATTTPLQEWMNENGDEDIQDKAGIATRPACFSFGASTFLRRLNNQRANVVEPEQKHQHQPKTLQHLKQDNVVQGTNGTSFRQGEYESVYVPDMHPRGVVVMANKPKEQPPQQHHHHHYHPSGQDDGTATEDDNDDEFEYDYYFTIGDHREKRHTGPPFGAVEPPPRVAAAAAVAEQPLSHPSISPDRSDKSKTSRSRSTITTPDRIQKSPNRPHSAMVTRSRSETSRSSTIKATTPDRIPRSPSSHLSVMVTPSRSETSSSSTIQETSPDQIQRSPIRHHSAMVTVSRSDQSETSFSTITKTTTPDRIQKSPIRHHSAMVTPSRSETSRTTSDRIPKSPNSHFSASSRSSNGSHSSHSSNATPTAAEPLMGLGLCSSSIMDHHCSGDPSTYSLYWNHHHHDPLPDHNSNNNMEGSISSHEEDEADNHNFCVENWNDLQYYSAVCVDETRTGCRSSLTIVPATSERAAAAAAAAAPKKWELNPEMVLRAGLECGGGGVAGDEATSIWQDLMPQELWYLFEERRRRRRREDPVSSVVFPTTASSWLDNDTTITS